MISRSTKFIYNNIQDFLISIFSAVVLGFSIFCLYHFQYDYWNFQTLLACLLLSITFLLLLDNIFFWAYAFGNVVCWFNTTGAWLSSIVRWWAINLAFFYSLVYLVVYNQVFWTNAAWDPNRELITWLLFIAVFLLWIYLVASDYDFMYMKYIHRLIVRTEKPAEDLAIFNWNLQNGNSINKEPVFDKQFKKVLNFKPNVFLTQESNYLDFKPFTDEGYVRINVSSEGKATDLTTLVKGTVTETKRIHYENQYKNNKSAFLFTSVKMEKSPHTYIFNTHLHKSNDYKTQSRQVKELVKFMDDLCDKSECNIILGGTFNIDSNMHALRYLSYMLEDTFSWGALNANSSTSHLGEKKLPICSYYSRDDYLFVVGNKLELIKSQIGGSGLSNHKYVAARLETHYITRIDSESGETEMRLNSTEGLNNDSSIK